MKHGFAPFIVIAAGEVDREADFSAYDQENLRRRGHRGFCFRC
ncbi:hypothetical protein ACVOMV_37220 [Mesorhizobium atlanticum]